MPATEQKFAPPSDNDRLGPLLRENHTNYAVLKDGRVWVMPDDEEPYYAKYDDYPESVKEERRLHRAKDIFNTGKSMAKHADENAIYLRLQQEGSALKVFSWCRDMIWKVARHGQHSAVFRCVLEEGDSGPPLQSEIRTLKAFLDGSGFKVQRGLPKTTPVCLGQPNPSITYQPWTISW